MDMKEYFLRLADYQEWATRVLYEQVDKLSDEDYKAERGLFFGSIHGSLNHILLADIAWYGRFTAHEKFPFKGLDEEIEPDRAKLKERLLARPDVWKAYIATLSDADLAASFDYHDSSGNAKSFTLAYLLTHITNHATHHRGQISTALTELGLEAPVMDIPYYLGA